MLLNTVDSYVSDKLYLDSDSLHPLSQRTIASEFYMLILRTSCTMDVSSLPSANKLDIYVSDMLHRQ